MSPKTRKYLRIAGISLAGLAVGVAVAECCVVLPPRLALSSYMRGHSIRKLQIGAGGYHPDGWLNTDIEPSAGEMFLDASKPFPIPDGSFDYVFAEHVIEHISYWDAPTTLGECHRILRPGGKIRIATPNLLKLVKLFQQDKSDEERNYIAGKTAVQHWPAGAVPETVILNLELRLFGHQFVYDPATLRDLLARAGFADIAEFRPGESDDPALSGLELRHKSYVQPVNDYETMVFEAVRR